ncbi:MAG: hypothetical protein U1E65_29540 [Myxococcota bacterium]
MRTTTPWIFAAAVAFAPFGARAEEPEQQPEELSRGPIHEAFAAPTQLDPSAGFVIPREPPAPVPESPPDVKPEGARVIWINGYWSWDEERSDFVWVSGVWRDAPPGRHFVPGSFVKVEQGWRWSPGYWDLDESPSEDLVQDPPPPSLEKGPNSPAPHSGQAWVNGLWVWEGGWVWRPGYWVDADADWVWTPASWCWTPRGYLFVAGYYDYVFWRRGHLFAPVWFRPGWVWAPGYRWHPHRILEIDRFGGHFFAHNSYRHYYYGDYHRATWSGSGLRPWVRTEPPRSGTRGTVLRPMPRAPEIRRFAPASPGGHHRSGGGRHGGRR